MGARGHLTHGEDGGVALADAVLVGGDASRFRIYYEEGLEPAHGVGLALLGAAALVLALTLATVARRRRAQARKRSSTSARGAG